MASLVFARYFDGPECRWMSDDPVCRAKCTPMCDKPNCIALCHPDDVNAVCTPPACESDCSNIGDAIPEDSCPACSVKCGPLRCRFNTTACETQCTQISCGWHCRKPFEHECKRPRSVLGCEDVLCKFEGVPNGSATIGVVWMALIAAILNVW